MRKLSIGWIGAALLLAGGLGGCGGGDAPAPGPRFRFDISDYPGIVVLPLEAFREGRPTNAGDDKSPESPIIQRIRQGADTPSDDPSIHDWDTLLGLFSNGMGDDRDVMRFYLAYEVTTNPTSGMCTVTIHVIEGLPYDPNHAPLASYTGSATFGEAHRDGFPIATANECEDEAAHRAAGELLMGPHFADGWSSGPPAHMQP